MHTSTEDIIYVDNLVFEAILGVLPEERLNPQPICISLRLSVDTQPAADSKELSDTLDYAQLASDVETLATNEKCLLVETLAQSIAQLALAKPHVSGAWIRIGKPNALSNAEQVGVEIYRRRA